LSVAILEETSEVDSFNEDELAEMFDVGSEISLNTLDISEKRGLLKEILEIGKKKRFRLL